MAYDLYVFMVMGASVRLSHCLIIILLSTFLFNGCRSMRCRPGGGGGGGGGDMGGGGRGPAQAPQAGDLVDADGNPIRNLTPEEEQRLQALGNANSTLINGTHGAGAGVLGGIRGGGRPLDVGIAATPPQIVQPGGVPLDASGAQAAGLPPATGVSTEAGAIGAPALPDGVQPVVQGPNANATPANNEAAIRPTVVQ